MQGLVEGLYGVIQVSVRGEYGEDGWAPSAREAPLAWLFMIGLFLASGSSVVFILMVWVKSSFGHIMSSISSPLTLCIIYNYRVYSLSSGVMDEIVGEFLVDSTFSESRSLPLELAANMVSLLGFEVDPGFASETSIVCACYGFLCHSQWPPLWWCRRRWSW